MAAGLALSIGVLAGWYAGFTIHNAEVHLASDSKVQPLGSYAVYEIPDGKAQQIANEYQRLGGRKVRQVALPQEGSLGQFRVTSPHLAQCLRDSPTTVLDDLPEECWPTDAASPVNLVALIAGAESVLADPLLMAEGRVGLLRFQPTGDVRALEDVTAQTDPELGGNLPGLLIPTGSPIAESLGLTPSGLSMLILSDFSTLKDSDQARIRSQVSQQAGAAQVSEGTIQPFYLREIAVARAFAIGAACFILGLLIVVGGAIAASVQQTRRVIQSMSAHPAAERNLAWALFGPTVLATCFAPLMTWVSIRMTAAPLPSNDGIEWLLPFAAATVGVVGAAALWLQRA